MEFFNEQTDKKIVQQYTNNHQQEIAEKLYTAMETGSWEHNMTHHKKTSGKAHHKRHDKCCDIGFERQWAYVQHMLLQNEIITDKKNENVK